MSERPVDLRQVVKTWWPLAASWLLMGVEGPGQSFVVAHMADSKVHLAAYGGVVFPLALIIEAPIIMLLAASTALSRDLPAYQSLRAFMHKSCAALTALHLLLAFTPLFDQVVVGLMEVPDEVVEPARWGMMIMTPWTWSIGYRRFNQGVLIRFGHPRVVTIGTALRLVANAITLAIGYFATSFPGVVVGASAVAVGVVTEAVYVGFRVRPVVRGPLSREKSEEPPLRGRAFLRFYLPLSLTSVLTLAAQPMCTGAMSQMPEALSSLAVWPLVIGLLFLFQALGLAYTEVVVAMLGRPGAKRVLWQFTLVLAIGTGVGVAVIALTPLHALWFDGVYSLDPGLTELGRVGLVLGILVPTMRALQSWYQGYFVHERNTRPVTESVIVFLVVMAGSLIAGGASHAWPALYVGTGAYALARSAQTVWLWVRSR